MKGAPPLRFVGLVLGGWICARAVMLAPGWAGEGEALQPAATLPKPLKIAARAAPVEEQPAPPSPTPGSTGAEPKSQLALSGRSIAIFARTQAVATVRLASIPVQSKLVPATPFDRPVNGSPPPFLGHSPDPLPLVRRWSGSAWAFFRRGDGRQLAAGGGLLGGSQAGARLGYRINDDPARPLAISARLYAPVRQPRGSEAALGVEWNPFAAVPVTFLAERRQRIGKDGRSAFAALAYGGVSERRLVGPVLLDAYVQAGVVGARRRDGFVDGSATIGMPVDEDQRLKLGLGVWGAAQPGVSRLDAGPQASYRLPIEGQAIRVTAEWRMRIVGDAVPGSGPALTLSTAF